MNTEQRITYSVAFKGVIELVSLNAVELETGDVVAEVIELTDAFYDALSLRTGLDDEIAPPKERVSAVAPSSRKRTRTSATQDSAPSGSTSESKGPRDPNKDASPAQIGFLKKLLGENNVVFDDGFDLNGTEYFFDEFTMGSIQAPIEALKK